GGAWVLRAAPRAAATLLRTFGRHVTWRSRERLDERSVGYFPHFDLAVPAPRSDQVAVRAKGNGVDPIGVACERAHGCQRVGVPDPYGWIGAASGEQWLSGMEDDFERGLAVAASRRDCLAVGDWIPAT